ncbi:MAG TPA: hypothetical protein VIM73_16740, partial [Polyangiaceae bacterium]
STLTYGGVDRSPTRYFDTTYEFAGSVWARTTTNTLGWRSQYGLTRDTSRAVNILFGGYDGSWRNEVWEQGEENWRRACVDVCAAAPVPAARGNMVFEYDETRRVTLLFGGSDDNRLWNDTWTWNGLAWQEHHPVNAPSPREGAASAYDPITGHIYVFGGSSNSGLLNDLWAWDGEDWQLIAETNAPSPRTAATLVWDTRRRRGILFGGRTETGAADFWELTVRGTPCETNDQCHSDRCEGTSCSSIHASGGRDAGPPGGSTGTGGSQVEGRGGGGGMAVAGDGGDENGGSFGAGAPSSGGEESSAGGGVSGASPAPGGSGGTSGAGTESLSRDGELKSIYACVVSGPAGTRPAKANPAAIASLAMMLALWGRRRARRHQDGAVWAKNQTLLTLRSRQA